MSVSTIKKIEDVRKALQLCGYDPDPGQPPKADVSCAVCPYFTEAGGCDRAALIADARGVIDELDITIRAMMGEFGDECGIDGCGGEDHE